MGTVIELKRQSIRIFNSNLPLISAYEFSKMILNKDMTNHLKCTEKSLLFALASYTNSTKDGGYHAYPSINRLCKQVSVSKGAIIQATSKLIDKGFIKVEKRTKADGGNASNYYTINYRLISTLPTI